MGFGGGGSGSFVLPNHDHTNVLADGGELLEATSLIDGITLKAWLDTAIAASVAANIPTIQHDSLGANVTTVSTSFVDITGLSITVPNKTNGKFMLTGVYVYTNSTSANIRFRFVDDATNINAVVDTSIAGNNATTTDCYTGNSNGQVVKSQFLTGSGTLIILAGALEDTHLESLEI